MANTLFVVHQIITHLFVFGAGQEVFRCFLEIFFAEKLLLASETDASENESKLYGGYKTKALC